MLIHRRGELRATSENARSIASKHKNLELKLCSSVISFDGDKKLKSITVKNNEKGKTEEIFARRRFFVAAGHIPSNEPFKDVAKLSADGYIVTNDDMETGIKGVFLRQGIAGKNRCVSLPLPRQTALWQRSVPACICRSRTANVQHFGDFKSMEKFKNCLHL